MPIRFFVIFGAFLISVLMWADRACIAAAKDSIREDLRLDDGSMGWIMGAFSLGYALFQVPAGKLADRFGPRSVLSGVCLLWSLFTALTGIAGTFFSMLAVRFLFGAGEAGGYPTITRALTSWLPMNERGIANSISFSGGRLGAALAMPTVVGLMQVLGGWRPTFIGFGLVGMVTAIVWWLAFRDTPETHPAVSDRERDYILQHRDTKVTAAAGQDDAVQAEQPTPSPDADAAAPHQAAALPTAVMLRSTNLLLLMFQYVAHNFTVFFTVTWFFDYLKKTYELTSMQTALYNAAPLLCGVLGNWIAGFTTDRLFESGRWRRSRRLPAMTGFVFAAVGMSLCVQMETPITAVACMCLAIFGSDMVLSPSWSTCMDIGRQDAGAVSGSMNMVGNLGALAASTSFPYLNQWWGSHDLFFYLAAAMNIAAILAWSRIRPDLPIHDETGFTKTSMETNA
ncbi:MAG: MFS transporter [Planctomycetota bacterium]